MGTRADFYIGRGKDAEWIGSIAWDGYPEGIECRDEKRNHLPWTEGKHLFDAETETEFRYRLELFFKYRHDVSLPSDGWPWPWEDSLTTDYAYAFDDGKVWCCGFCSAWFDPRKEQPESEEGKTAVFPNMKEKQKVTFGKRSGVLVFTAPNKQP